MVHTCVEESADDEYVHEYRLKHGCKQQAKIVSAYELPIFSI